MALARATKPDVAVLDLRMPMLDGIEAARRIYAERPIPIVMLTAFSERSYVDKAIVAGVVTYLVKPFREGESSRRSGPRRLDMPSCSRHGVRFARTDRSPFGRSKDER